MLPFPRHFRTVLSASALFGAPGFAQCPITPTDQWGGTVGTTAVVGNALFAQIGLDLVAFDIANQSAPQRVSETAIGSFTFVYGGGYLYIVADGLRVLDVSDPAMPVQVGQFNPAGVPENTPVGTPHFWRGYLYCPAAEGSNLIFDVSDVATPVLAGRFPGTESIAIELIESDLAYASFETRVDFWDVSSPGSPQFAGTYEHDERIWSLAAHGRWMYLADPWGLDSRPAAIVDAREPAAARQTGRLPHGRRDYSLVARDGLLLTTARNEVNTGHFLTIFSLADPAEPVLLAIRELSESGWLRTGDDDVILVYRQGTARLLNISLPNVPRLTGSLDAGFTENSQFGIREDLAYLGANASVSILRVTDGEIRRVGAVRIADYCVAGWCLPSPVSSLSVSSDFLLVNTPFQRLLFSLADPVHPVLVDAMVPAAPMLFVEEFLYQVGRDALRVYTLANPPIPELVHEIALSGETTWVRVSGQYLLRRDHQSDSLDVIDIRRPDQPVLLSTLPVTGYATAAASGNTVIVATEFDAYIHDISDPKQPTSHYLHGAPSGITSIVHSEEAWYCSTHDGLSAFILTEPRRALVRLETPDDGPGEHSVFIGPEFVATLSYGRGLTVYPRRIDGDLDADADIDLHDLVTLLAQFGSTTDAGPAGGDFDCDQQIGVGDLSILLASFGTGS